MKMSGIFFEACFSVVLVAQIVLVAPNAEAMATPTTAPVFNQSDCPPNLIPAELQGEIRARCGWVQVPQRHERPGLRPLVLPVDVFTSPTSEASATPLLYLSGGPGGPGIDEVILGFLRSPAGQVEVRERVVVAFDQRGTGAAEPVVQCPWLERDSRSFNQHTPPQTLIDDASSCRDTFRSQGLDIAAFNTTETAADIDDIRRALGYAVFDILGVSYGSAAALATLRDFPDDVEATILDGVVPLQEDVFSANRTVIRQQEALAAFMDDCASDLACAESYPDLRETFVRLAADDDELIHVEFSAVDGSAETADLSPHRIAQILQDLIDDPVVNAQIPLAATAALAGDGEVLSPIISRHVARNAANNRQARSMRLVDYDAVTCSDFASGTPIGGRDVCNALGVPDRSDMAAPVAAKGPVLLLSGAYDARTPPSLADEASQTLPSSYREVFPATGHGIYQFPQAAMCAAQVVRSFLNNPHAQPDDQCVSQVRRPQWVLPDSAS